MLSTARKTLLALLLCWGATPALGMPTLDFNLAPTITYAGGANPLIGTGLAIQTITGLDTPLNNNDVLALTGAL